MVNTTQEYIKENYTSINHYDLTMDILCDKLLDNLFDIKNAVNTHFNSENNADIEQAFYDYNE